MKKISLLLLIILMVSCKEGSEIEIITDYDEVYLSFEQVSIPAKSVDENFDENVVKKFKEIAKILHNDNIGKKIVFPMSYRLYIDEKGEIRKIKKLGKVLKSQSKIDTLIENGEVFEVYRDIDKMNQKIIPLVERWNFSPAIHSGKNIKYRKDILISILTYPNNIIEPKVQFSNLSPYQSEDMMNYFVEVDEMPYPIGGIKAIQEKIVYPETAKKEGIEGRVYVKAFINENGDVVSAEVIKGIGAGCDQEAISAVVNTKFKPARQNGKLVKVQVSIPILFKLN